MIKTKILRWAGHVARMRESGGSYRILVGVSERTSPLGRPKHRWKGNIKINLRKVGWGCGLDRSGLGQEQVASCCECGDEPSVWIKFGKFLV